MSLQTIVVGIAAIVLTVVAGLLGLIYRDQKARMDRHEQADDQRFADIARQNDERHRENTATLARLSRSQSRMSGALILALSSNATPEERREMIRALMEVEGN